MHVYEPRKFNIPKLDGISEKAMEAHIGLYEGYVKNFNALSKSITEFATQDWEKYTNPVAEMIRRRSFEFDGMRLHEQYFEQFEGGSTTLTTSGSLAKILENEYGRGGGFERVMQKIGGMRGPGWAMLYWDPHARELLTAFVEDQRIGHFVSLPVILALDVWEHAFILDFGAQGKSGYMDAFFKNLNWDVIEKRFAVLT